MDKDDPFFKQNMIPPGGNFPNDAVFSKTSKLRSLHFRYCYPSHALFPIANTIGVLRGAAKIG